MSAREIFAVLFLSVLIFSTGPLLADGDEPVVEEVELGLPWMTDFNKAKETALAEGKDLLINFTGSDWCIWCKRLEDEVFSKATFHEETGSQFIYVFLDFPRAPEAQEKVIDPDLNAKLHKDFGEPGFPTIILADAKGRPYARTGYQEGGPEKYLEHVSTLRENGKKIKALLANEDPEKEAGFLTTAFGVLMENDLFSFPEFEKYLVAAEKLEDEEIVAALAKMRSNRELEALMNTDAPDFPALVKFLDDHPEMDGPTSLNACWFASQWLKDQGKHDEAIGLLERMLGDPILESNERGQEMIKNAIAAIEKASHGGGEGHDHDGDGIPDH